MAEIIKGDELAARIKADIRSKVEALRRQGKRLPGLTVILVGDDPASVSYVTYKQRACAAVGMIGRVLRYPATMTRAELTNKIAELNHDDTVDGILIQLPLPAGFDETEITALVAVDKDVDGLHPLNIARLQLRQEGLTPCTPSGVMEMLHSIAYDLTGKRVVIIGRSNLVGRPLAQMMINQNATVTVCHSKTVDLAGVCREADVLVSAVGHIGLVTADFVKPQAVVIDVGTSRGADGKLHGDVDFAAVEPHVAYLTPVPKGVGPMTIAMLLANTLKAYENRENKQ